MVYEIMNNKAIIYKTDYLTIEHSAKEKYLLNTWKGHTSKENFLNCIDKIIGFLNEKGVCRIIADVRQQQPLGPDAYVKAKQKLINFAQEHGDCKLAFIVSGHSPNDTRTPSEVHHGSVVTAYFTHFKKAENWITKFVNKPGQNTLKES